VRVLIVDDNPVVRLALRGVCRHDYGVDVIGEACTGDSALEAVKTLKPDVVCLDILMPGCDGLAALRRIREEHPTVRVVIISGNGTATVVKEALANGAHGFVVKPFTADKVLKTLHASASCSF